MARKFWIAAVAAALTLAGSTANAAIISVIGTKGGVAKVFNVDTTTGTAIAINETLVATPVTSTSPNGLGVGSGNDFVYSSFQQIGNQETVYTTQGNSFTVDVSSSNSGNTGIASGDLNGSSYFYSTSDGVINVINNVFTTTGTNVAPNHSLLMNGGALGDLVINELGTGGYVTHDTNTITEFSYNSGTGFTEVASFVGSTKYLGLALDDVLGTLYGVRRIAPNSNVFGIYALTFGVGTFSESFVKNIGGQATGWTLTDASRGLPVSSQVPEPATFALLGLGLSGFAMARRRMQKRA